MINHSPLVSVIIPHYNGEVILKDCLSSLFKSTKLALEVILVDNGSTDSSVSMVKRDFPEVKIIALSENHGFAGGCNIGIRESTAPYVLILNNDTIHQAGWLELLTEKIESRSTVAAVQPKLLSYQEREYFDYSGAAGGEVDIFCFPFARGRIFEHIEKDSGQYDNYPDRIFWASGTACLAKRRILVDAGLFDEEYFAHMEEIDLQWRMHLMGYETVAEPRSIIYHRSGYTLGAEAPLKKYLNHRNSLITFLSNYSLPVTSYLLLPRIALDIMALLFALFIFDFSRCLAIVKAYFFVIAHPKIITSKRKKVKAIRTVNDRKILSNMYKGSIALAYYLFRKKRYSDL